MKTFTLTDKLRKGCEIVFNPLLKGSMLAELPVAPSVLKSVEGMLWAPTPIVVHWLDVRDGRLVPEEDPEDRRALLLVQTAAGEGGRRTLLPNSLEDRFDGTTVSRWVRGAFPPPGIEVLCNNEAEEETLLVLHPGASFRIHRDGDLQGADAEMVVGWDGTWSPTAKGPPRNRPDGGVRHWGMYLFSGSR